MQYGWFRRNLWHHVSHYAITREMAPDGSGNCTSPYTGASSDCLTVKYTAANDTHRGLIIIAGRRLPGQSPRPNGTFDQWFEGENGNDANGVIYAVREPIGIPPDYIPLTVNRTFNDRVAVIDKN
jgi:hypothetical protein